MMNKMTIEVHPHRRAMGMAAAKEVATEIRARLGERQDQNVRIVFASAPSQLEMLQALAAEPDIEWERVTAFHLDEYIGSNASVEGSFGKWLKDSFFDRVQIGQVHLINPDRDANLAAEEYSRVLQAAPIDVACLGIGDNGHIAFNEPHRTDFDDLRRVRIVSLDERSRLQQVEDGLFDEVDDVPDQAITLTIPALLEARRLVCVVPGTRKRDAVRRALSDPIGPDCPATALRLHPACTLHLDAAAAPTDIGGGAIA